MTVSGASTAEFAEDPNIRPSQFGSQDQESVLRSVNVFGGDVNLPLTFVSLKGRNGLDLSVSAQYQSSVSQQVTT